MITLITYSILNFWLINNISSGYLCGAPRREGTSPGRRPGLLGHRLKIARCGSGVGNVCSDFLRRSQICPFHEAKTTINLDYSCGLPGDMVKFGCALSSRISPPCSGCAPEWLTSEAIRMHLLRNSNSKFLHRPGANMSR